MSGQRDAGWSRWSSHFHTESEVMSSCKQRSCKAREAPWWLLVRPDTLRSQATLSLPQMRARQSAGRNWLLYLLPTDGNCCEGRVPFHSDQGRGHSGSVTEMHECPSRVPTWNPNSAANLSSLLLSWESLSLSLFPPSVFQIQ